MDLELSDEQSWLTESVETLLAASGRRRVAPAPVSRARPAVGRARRVRRAAAEEASARSSCA